jgi:hypothetical protein
MRFSSCHCASHLAHAVARRLCCNRSKTRAALTSRLFFSTYPIHVAGRDVWSATMVCLAGAERALANCSWSAPSRACIPSALGRRIGLPVPALRRMAGFPMIQTTNNVIQPLEDPDKIESGLAIFF